MSEKTTKDEAMICFWTALWISVGVWGMFGFWAGFTAVPIAFFILAKVFGE